MLHLKDFNTGKIAFTILWLYMGVPEKWWSPTTMDFSTQNDHFGVFCGYDHLRKHPYTCTKSFNRIPLTKHKCLQLYVRYCFSILGFLGMEKHYRSKAGRFLLKAIWYLSRSLYPHLRFLAAKQKSFWLNINNGNVTCPKIAGLWPHEMVDFKNQIIHITCVYRYPNKRKCRNTLHVGQTKTQKQQIILSFPDGKDNETKVCDTRISRAKYWALGQQVVPFQTFNFFGGNKRSVETFLFMSISFQVIFTNKKL